MGRQPTQHSRRVIVLAACFSFAAMFAWSPWLSPARAVNQVKAAFETKWHGVADGCSLDNSGIRSVKRTVFGYSIKIEYACGMLPSNSREFYRYKNVYVSPFATVHNLP